ncbi:MAG: ABC transporter ATP-binding protein [Bacilli bacterium]|nr:ABC transporter ATP-binding protein [Bacilli bacterium]
MNTKNLIKQAFSNKVRSLIFLVLMVILTAVLSIFSYWIVKVIIDNVIPNKDFDLLVFWIVMLSLTSILSFIFNSINQNNNISLGNYVTQYLRENLYSTVLRADLLEIEKMTSKEIIKRINRDTSKIGDSYITNDVLSFFGDSIFLIFLLIVLLVSSPLIALVVFCTLPIYYALVKTFQKLYKKSEPKIKEILNEGQFIMNETLDKVKTVKLRNCIKFEEDNFKNWNEKNVKMKKQNNLLYKMNKHYISDLFVGLVLAINISIGVWIVIADPVGLNLTVGTLVLCVFLIPKIFSSFRNLLAIKISNINITSAIENLDEIFAFKSESKFENIESLDEIYSVKFKDVYFHYLNNDFKLQNINFEVQKGQKIGIYGDSQSGKTTIFNLLTKLAVPRTGSILINNCDITKINTFYLRDIMASITAESDIFRTSIINNIVYPYEFDDYKYNDALNRSGLKDYVLSLPDGGDTIIDENLDPIIKQRIILANGLYKDSKIILLDNACDLPENEKIIDEVLKLKNKIFIILSNNIAQLNDCDKIIILENGKISEYGEIEELEKNKNSLYNQLNQKSKIKKFKSFKIS